MNDESVLPLPVSPVHQGGSGGELKDASELVPEVLKNLSLQAQKFSEYFACSSNIRKSSILAGCHRDYGHQLLKDPRVQSAVEYFRELYADSAVYTPGKIVRQWAEQASFDLTAVLESDWSVKNLDELSEETRAQLRHALVGIEVIEKQGGRTIRPKFAKVEALQELGKLLGMYKDVQSGQQGLSLSITIGHSTAENALESSSVRVGHLGILVEGGEGESGP